MIQRKRSHANRRMPASGPAATSTRRPLPGRHRHRPCSITGRPSPSGRERLGWASSNWSGYALSGRKGRFRSISAEWRVPTVRPTRQPSYSSAWIGIDGFRNSSLIQTGTAHEFVDGKARYYAWWEILPAAETPIPYPVLPGDRMRASIRRQSSGLWRIALCNLTRGWSFCTDRSYSGPMTSAEWILEPPFVDGAPTRLAALTPVCFFRCRVNGRNPRLRLRDGGILIQNGRVYAVPTAPSARGDAFAVRRLGPPLGKLRLAARLIRRKPCRHPSPHTKSNG
ncbi:G1 family glutamic endopeptidase [Paenibacillus spiritus]|nr:G1 family glutamic endopeptidase [Paenibacillus spiritus]